MNTIYIAGPVVTNDAFAATQYAELMGLPLHKDEHRGDPVLDGRYLHVDGGWEWAEPSRQGGNCPHSIKPLVLPLQRNALRVEAVTPGHSCAVMPKKDRFGRKYEVLRWVFSGGDPVVAAHSCVTPGSCRCPRHTF